MTEPMFNLIHTVDGAFFLDGPAQYMDARGIDIMNALVSGTAILLDQLLLRHADWQQAVLARLQLDYANWKGVTQFVDGLQPALFANTAEPDIKPVALVVETVAIEG